MDWQQAGLWLWAGSRLDGDTGLAAGWTVALDWQQAGQ